MNELQQTAYNGIVRLLVESIKEKGLEDIVRYQWIEAMQGHQSLPEQLENLVINAIDEYCLNNDIEEDSLYDLGIIDDYSVFVDEALDCLEGISDIMEEPKQPTICEAVRAIQTREQEELRQALREKGHKTYTGYYWLIAGGTLVAGYWHDEPCDLYITAVELTGEGELVIFGHPKEDTCEAKRIDPYDIFAGHVEFITSEIGE